MELKQLLNLRTRILKQNILVKTHSEGKILSLISRGSKIPTFRLLEIRQFCAEAPLYSV